MIYKHIRISSNGILVIYVKRNNFDGKRVLFIRAFRRIILTINHKVKEEGEGQMGYIMPVDRYQYINYQERLGKERLSLAPVNSTFPVLLDKTHQEIADEYDRKLPSTFEQVPTNPRSNSVVEATYAEITGSGGHFTKLI